MTNKKIQKVPIPEGTSVNYTFCYQVDVSGNIAALKDAKRATADIDRALNQSWHRIIGEVRAKYPKLKFYPKQMIKHTEICTTGSVTDIPGWQTKTPEQLAVSALAMGMSPEGETGEVLDWTQDIKSIPGWQNMPPQQIADRIRASRMKWWEKPPEAGQPLHRVFCPRCSMVIPMFHEGHNYTGSTCPGCLAGVLQKFPSAPAIVAAALESKEKFDVKDFQAKERDVAKAELAPEVQQVMQERGKVYGEPHLSHENIGLEWTGLLQQHYQIRLDHPIPHWLVEMMMSTLKIHRAARIYHPDNFLDAKSYLEFAEHGQANPDEPYVKHKPLPEEK